MGMGAKGWEQRGQALLTGAATVVSIVETAVVVVVAGEFMIKHEQADLTRAAWLVMPWAVQAVA